MPRSPTFSTTSINNEIQEQPSVIAAINLKRLCNIVHGGWQGRFPTTTSSSGCLVAQHVASWWQSRPQKKLIENKITPGIEHCRLPGGPARAEKLDEQAWRTAGLDRMKYNPLIKSRCWSCTVENTDGIIVPQMRMSRERTSTKVIALWFSELYEFWMYKFYWDLLIQYEKQIILKSTSTFILRATIFKWMDSNEECTFPFSWEIPKQLTVDTNFNNVDNFSW